MSTIRNNNTTGGGMYAPSQGINTALSNPNGITGVHQSNGAGGFSGNAEHFYTGPFNSTPAPAPGGNPSAMANGLINGRPQNAAPAPAPDYSGQLNGMYNELLGRDIKQGGLDYWSNDLANGASIDDVRANVMRGQEYADYQASQTSPYQADMAVSNMPAAPGAPFGGAPNDPTLQYYDGRQQRGGQPSLPPIPQSGGPMNAVMSGGPPQTAAYGYGHPPLASQGLPPAQQGGGPMGVVSGGPPQTPAYGYGQQGGGIGNNLLGGWNGGQQGGYGYGQGSNVSMLQALMGGGGNGYGDFLSQLLSRYGQ